MRYFKFLIVLLGLVVPALDRSVSWTKINLMRGRQLQQELDALQADIKKAEKRVREDIGL